MSVFNSVKANARKAQFEANKLYRANQVQREISSTKRQIQQAKFNVGSAAYELFHKGELVGEGLISKCEEVKELERQILALEEKIEEIKKEELYIDEDSSIELPSIPKPSLASSVSIGSGLPKGHLISSPAAAFAILFFFMPWVLASCGSQPVASLSGWDFAAGVTVDTGFGAEILPASPHVFLVLLSALFVIALAYIAWRRGRANKLDSLGLVVLGIIPLAILYLGFGDSSLRDEAAMNGIQMEFQTGFWGTVISFIAIMLGGVLNWRQPKLPKEAPSKDELEFDE